MWGLEQSDSRSAKPREKGEGKWGKRLVRRQSKLETIGLSGLQIYAIVLGTCVIAAVIRRKKLGPMLFGAREGVSPSDPRDGLVTEKKPTGKV